MKYSVSESAIIIGYRRQTLNRHIKEKNISFSLVEGKKMIEASELMRVYGERVNFDRLNKNNTYHTSDKVPASNGDDGLRQVTQNDNPSITKILQEKIELETTLAKRDHTIEILNDRKSQYEDEIESLRSSLKLSQEGHNKATLLLENKSSEYGGVGAIQKSLAALEDRIEKNEQSVQAEKERTESALLAKQDYQSTATLLYIVSGLLFLMLAAVAALYNQDALLALLNR